MAQKDSIIDHRNINSLYAGWIGSLAVAVASAILAYTLQHTTPFLHEKSLLVVYMLIGLSGVAAGLAVLFKFVFKREIISWIFAGLISLAGLAVFLFYGWNWGFSIFHITSLVLLMALGPYLYFD